MKSIHLFFILGLCIFGLSDKVHALNNQDMIAVVEQTAGQVSFYDIEGTNQGSVQVGDSPHEIIVTKDGQTAYVSNFGLQDYDETIGIPGTSISVIDIPNRTEKYRLYTFDTKENKNFSAIDKAPHGMRLRPPSEQHLYVNVEKGHKILVYDVNTHKIIKKYRVSPYTHNLFFSADGKTLWLMAGPDGVIRMDPDTGEVTGTFKLSTPVRGLTYTADQHHLLVSGKNEVVLLDPDTLTVYKHFENLEVGQILYSDITPDGKYIIAPAVWENQVLIIDTQSQKVIQRIVTGLNPVTVKISAEGDKAFVTNARDNHVTQIDLTTFNSTEILTKDGPNGLAVLPFIPAKEHKTFTLGVALPLSGKDSQHGYDMMLGYEYWRLLVRNAGGLWMQNQAHDVNIVYLDTQSNQDILPELNKKLLLHYKVQALLEGFDFNQYKSKINWQPSDIANTEIPFVTTQALSEQFEKYYHLKLTDLAFTAIKTGIALQKKLSNDKGVLYVPTGKGSFPAIIMLHASGGVGKIDHTWANLLKEQGYVVYLVDSFTPRHYKDRKSIGWEKATAAQLADVDPAFKYLSSLPYVDKKRIGLFGTSMGGYDVLRVMQKDNPFKAAAVFFGVCKRIDADVPLHGPLKIWIGEKDDRSTTAACETLVKKNQDNNVFITVYPNAPHGFDNPEFPALLAVEDEYGEEYHVGYNEKAQKAAMQDLMVFLNQYLNK